jgi:hypothetical protein
MAIIAAPEHRVSAVAAAGRVHSTRPAAVPRWFRRWHSWRRALGPAA